MGRKCSQCGLIYISPRPSCDEIINLYKHDGAHVSAVSDMSAELEKRLYARHNLKIITSLTKNGTILEIGTGAGYFLDEARKIGFEPYGIELNTIQANFVRNELGIPCEESPLTSSLFDRKKFDVVYHCDVISHFFAPILEFKKIREKTKEGGFLIFETGNIGEVNQKYFKYIQRFQYPDHLFFFNTYNLRELLERTGFELVKIYRYSIIPQLVGIKILTKIKKLVVKLYKRNRLSKENDCERNPSESIYKSPQTNSIVRKLMKIGETYLAYFLRYKVGYIVPKTCRPQTVIVVAQKRCIKPLAH